jgi:hypothetical protein
VEVSVGELAGSLEPVEDVEVEVVSTGAAAEDQGKNGDQRDERKDYGVTGKLSVGHSFILPFVYVGDF